MSAVLAPSIRAAARRKPFAIGLAPLDPAAWLEIDAARPADLALKRRLYAEDPGAVFAEAPGAEAAQEEALRLVEAQLAAGGVPPAPLPENAAPAALLQAAFQVQEDLLLLQRAAADAPYRLTAGALFFPSAWSLREKFGRPIAEIHDPVPGFGRGSRNAAVIDRMFAALRPEAPLERSGWSIYPDGALSHPLIKLRGAAARAAPSLAARAAAILADPHLRVERQTLRKLPETGALLFTVRIHILRLADLEAAQPRTAEIRAVAADLAAALAALSEDALAFKNLGLARDPLLARLRALADPEAG